MPTWDSSQYLKFADERTRACRDLAARVAVPQVRTAVDLGCGPGNSTAIVAERWPQATITGIDNSEDMIAAARETQPAIRWVAGDIGAWAASGESRWDVVFSNAALQWVDDHARIFPLLLSRVQSGGALAAQMPGNFDGPAHRLMRDLASSHSWRRHFPEGRVREWHVHDLAFYYDVLAPHAALLDLWETEYQHIMRDAEAIVEWYKGTGLRPFLEALDSEGERARFRSDYLEQIRRAYPRRSDGRVLFPFRRLFIVAYRENLASEML